MIMYSNQGRWKVSSGGQAMGLNYSKVVGPGHTVKYATTLTGIEKLYYKRKVWTTRIPRSRRFLIRTEH